MTGSYSLPRIDEETRESFLADMGRIRPPNRNSPQDEHLSRVNEENPAYLQTVEDAACVLGLDEEVDFNSFELGATLGYALLARAQESQALTYQWTEPSELGTDLGELQTIFARISEKIGPQKYRKIDESLRGIYNVVHRVIRNREQSSQRLSHSDIEAKLAGQIPASSLDGTLADCEDACEYVARHLPADKATPLIDYIIRVRNALELNGKNSAKVRNKGPKDFGPQIEDNE